MKIAYLLLAHDHPLHLVRLIAAIQTEHAHIFLHIDKKSRGMMYLPNTNTMTVIKDAVTVNWGGFSIVQATLNLLQEATTCGEYDYFILLSGADYPIRSNASILRHLEHYQGKEFMNLCKMPEVNKTFDRIVYPFIENKYDFALPGISKAVNGVIKRINKKLHSRRFKRRYPQQYAHLTFYAGTQWWALSRPCVDYILQFLKQNPAYSQFYKYTRVPDEMFFHTMIGNSPFKENVVNAFMYADWVTGPSSSHPAIITLQHLPLFSQNTLPSAYGNGEMIPLFARKFTDDSQEIITEIDALFRNENEKVNMSEGLILGNR